MQPVYATQSTRAVDSFLNKIAPQFEENKPGQVVLDSVRADVANTPGVTVPPALDKLLGQVGEKDEGRLLDAVSHGLKHFRYEHGVMPTADVVEAAIQQAGVAFVGIDTRGNLLDSATSNHHDQISLQPNRAVVAILSAIAEAIPFAAYLPVDIGSNQSKLAILSHRANGAYGDYAANDIMDGTRAGDVYASSSRMVRFDVTGSAPYNRAFTKTNLTADLGYCDPNGAATPVLRGRSIVFVNGIPVCTDTASGSAANSAFSGSINISGTDYPFAGYVTVATGAIQITTGSFPSGTEVTAQAFIDYEAAPANIPSVIVRADVFDIFANPWRVMTAISIDAQGQLKNELGLDGDSEALMAIRTQMALERHYLALRMAFNLGKNNVVDYDFDYDNQITQKIRAQIWQDFASVIGNADQAMANATMDHGITHLYCPAWICSQMMSLPAELFVPSGIPARPSIYRVGRLFGKYDVYYSPKGPTQSLDLTSASMIAVGRSTQVARCPIVLGDAVAPTFLPLNMQANLMQQSAMYARDYTVVNPHGPSALGAARINVSNLF